MTQIWPTATVEQKKHKKPHCCKCERRVAWEPKVPGMFRSGMAIRCVYCMRIFCVPCSKEHFGKHWTKIVRRKASTTIIRYKVKR